MPAPPPILASADTNGRDRRKQPNPCDIAHATRIAAFQSRRGTPTPWPVNEAESRSFDATKPDGMDHWTMDTRQHTLMRSHILGMIKNESDQARSIVLTRNSRPLSRWNGYVTRNRC